MSYEYMSGMGIDWSAVRDTMHQGPCEAPWRQKTGGESDRRLEKGCKSMGIVSGGRTNPVYGWCCPPECPTGTESQWHPGPTGQTAREYALQEQRLLGQACTRSDGITRGNLDDFRQHWCCPPLPRVVAVDRVPSPEEIRQKEAERRASEERRQKEQGERMLMLSLANVALSAIIAPSGQRGIAAVVGGIASFVGFSTGIAFYAGMALCPFSGEGAIACGLPMMGLPGIATGLGFRIAPHLRGDDSQEEKTEALP